MNAQTQTALEMHKNSLMKLSSEYQDITKDDMLSNQYAIQEIGKQTVQKLKGLMMLPILGSFLIACALVLAAAGWSWYHLGEMDQKLAAKERELQSAEMALSNTKLQIDKYTNEFCATPAGKTACKTTRK